MAARRRRLGWRKLIATFFSSLVLFSSCAKYEFDLPEEEGENPYDGFRTRKAIPLAEADIRFWAELEMLLVKAAESPEYAKALLAQTEGSPFEEHDLLANDGVRVLIEVLSDESLHQALLAEDFDRARELCEKYQERLGRSEMLAEQVSRLLEANPSLGQLGDNPLAARISPDCVALALASVVVGLTFLVVVLGEVIVLAAVADQVLVGYQVAAYAHVVAKTQIGIKGEGEFMPMAFRTPVQRAIALKLGDSTRAGQLICDLDDASVERAVEGILMRFPQFGKSRETLRMLVRRLANR